MWNPVHLPPIKLLAIVILCLWWLSPDLGVSSAGAKSKKPPKEKSGNKSDGIPEFLKNKKVAGAGAVPDFLKGVKEPDPASGSSSESPVSGGALESSPAPHEADSALEPSLPSPVAPSTTSAPRTRLLHGKTEKTHIVLEKVKLYEVAMKAIKKKDYEAGIRYLQMLTPKLDKPGNEPLVAQIMYHEAGCHKNLKRMNAALGMYNKAYELFAKYDESNPLKGKAWKEYEVLRAMKAKMDSNPLQGGVDSSVLQARAQKRNIALELQRAKFAINPNVTLKGTAKDVLLRCNDQKVLPKIVEECFAGMSCLETAEIGSNVSNALNRWIPLRVHGQTAAFAVSSHAKPTIRAIVNGRTYNFNINLPGLRSGRRKILVLTNLQKICAVDVDTFDTWLLRMKRARDGRVIAARWGKLEHAKKFEDKTRSSIFRPTILQSPEERAW